MTDTRPNTFTPDHNGECTHCDEPGDAHLCPPGSLEAPIALNEEQDRAATEWAADDRLWTTEDTVAFNLRAFAREILGKQ